MSEHDTPTASPRRGRRPGPGSSRRSVLDAAKARFAADGFAATTIRAIAADAGVDPSQVIQFFGSKDELFAAAMAFPPTALARFDTVFEGADDHLGERVVRAFLDAWEGPPDESEPLMAMLRGAIVHEEAAAQLREFLQSRLLHGAVGHRADAAPGAPAADTALRAGIVASMLVGLVTARRIVGVPVLEAADRETLVATVAPAVQVILVPGGAAAPVDGTRIGCPGSRPIA